MGVTPSILFWPAAATLAGLSALLVLWFGARAARRAATSEVDDPAQIVYRRQLQDLDELVERGVLPAEEHEAARAEAARRLLAEPDKSPERSGSRLLPLMAAAGAALAALGLYLWLGAPGMADRPYRARIAEWKATPVNQLQPDQMAAVLRELVKDKPNDPRLLALLGRVERAAGDPVAAMEALRRATALQPDNADLYAALGEATAAAAGDKPTPDAEAALNKALSIDPNNQAALYYLGGARAADGDGPGAAKLWRRLAALLPDNDVRRAPLLATADKVETGQATTPPAATAQAPAMSGDQAGFIRGMVASLKARLDASPNDPAGWARLVRSYRVLGDKPAEEAALTKARTLFKDRPTDLAPIEAEAK